MRFVKKCYYRLLFDYEGSINGYERSFLEYCSFILDVFKYKKTLL